MAPGYIEPRPKSRDTHAPISNYTIVSDGVDFGVYSTQEAAIDAACKAGYRPVYVARVRHIPDHGNPDHFRHHKCPGE